jgi:hypothetical protein
LPFFRPLPSKARLEARQESGATIQFEEEKRMDQCKSRLSLPRQKLLDIIQQLTFGKIESLIVIKGEPDFSRPPTISREIKLGIEPSPRLRPTEADFILKREFIDLFENLDQLPDKSIVTIETRHSLPARLIVVERGA